MTHTTTRIVATIGLVFALASGARNSARAVIPAPDLSTSVKVVSSNFGSGKATVTVTNLDSARSAKAKMVITVSPTQTFSYSAYAGSDCTVSTPPNTSKSQFDCAVAEIVPGGNLTRDITVQNKSNQGPRYLQLSVTTSMPGDTNPNNDRAGATVTFK